MSNEPAHLFFQRAGSRRVIGGDLPEARGARFGGGSDPPEQVFPERPADLAVLGLELVHLQFGGDARVDVVRRRGGELRPQLMPSCDRVPKGHALDPAGHQPPHDARQHQGAGGCGRADRPPRPRPEDNQAGGKTEYERRLVSRRVVVGAKAGEGEALPDRRDPAQPERDGQQRAEGEPSPLRARRRFWHKFGKH